ncbi:MAG TPA: choice-of-anchor tandem repeat GloVer-containing protein, partial [Candidatus Acidoferrales bacterium]|nr:choice-of-anchor tandem repeat GloVer-containing protein [Candidatus Acidoferrales bacterium]
PSGAEATIYSFGAPSHTGDGLTPYGGLTNVSGVLYGTTEYGGAGGYCPSSGGCGTVFRVTTSGAETLLHSFGSTPEDGQNPYLESLINVNGKLYGTTSSGGAHGHGTIFRITKSGAETVLYSFGGGSGDGAYPFSGLVKVNGTLYGTTYRGGAHGFGTFFSLSGF